MKSKTEFINVLERLHKSSDERYGQIIDNAVRFHKGKPKLDIINGRYFDPFYYEDEEFSKILLEYEKMIKRVK